ncbi:MAG: M48 family metalloprotease [Thermosphaera sp.]
MLFYDVPLFLAMIIAYAIGFVALMLLAGLIAPKVARRLTNKFSLYTSMYLAGFIAVFTGVAGLALISIALADVLGTIVTAAFIIGLALFILIINVFSYLFSPLMINLAYRATPDNQLQEIVNRVAGKAGFKKPPKAVVVRGPPNAFAYGNPIFGKYVAVSSEMLRITNREELEAVIGHELGHHKHRDNAIMLFMGIFPSIIYYLGVMLIRLGIISGASRLSRDRRSNGGVFFILIGIAAVILSFIVQVLVLAFSRLREYYADAHGAKVSSPRNMQRALAKLHLYYEYNDVGYERLSNSKLKALFIYALSEAFANPFYHYIPPPRDFNVDVDQAIEELKKKEESGFKEIMSTHPPIPKRLRFLDYVGYRPVKVEEYV